MKFEALGMAGERFDYDWTVGEAFYRSLAI
jgi:hypothetical protein